jgi:hypothetical protein
MDDWMRDERLRLALEIMVAESLSKWSTVSNHERCLHE